MQKVKIKLTKTPKPLYQQDSLGGLDAYYLPMQYKKAEEEDGIRHNEKEVDRKDSNAELEKGEVVFSPMVDIPQLTLVGGEKHSKGGTPVKLNEGDFVFSEHLKMSDAEKEVLGASGKNPSYASVLKKFVKPFNNSVNTIKTSDDDIDVRTAAMNIENIKNKAAKVALLQESSKGFPNGIPEFMGEEFEDVPEMKDGGKYKYQDGGDEKTYPKWLKAWYKSNTEKGRTSPTGFKPTTYPEDKVIEDDYRYWSHIAGREFTDAKDYQKFVYSTVEQDNPDSIKQMWDTYGHTAKSKKQDMDNFTDEIFGVRSADLFRRRLREQGISKPVGFPTMKPTNPTVTTPQASKTSVTEQTPAPVEDPLNPNSTGKTYTKPFKDTGYGWMESVGMFSPFAQAIKKYAPVKKAIEAEQIGFRPVDFEAERQSVKGQVQQMAEVNQTMSPTSSMASARNAQLLGTSANALNESFMREFNANQLGYQQVEAQNAATRQQANQVNAGFAESYDANYAQMNENFDARKAQRFRQFLQNWQTAEKSRQTRNALNYMLTDYEIGPNSEIFQVAQTADQRMARIAAGNSSSGSSAPTPEQYVEMIQKLANQKKIDFKEAKSVIDQFYKGSGTRWSETDTDNDGVPNRTSRTSSSPTQFNAMFQMLQQAGIL